MFTNGSLYDPALSLGQWDRRPDPALQPRKDGRRMSGSTMEDFILPIIENGRKYQGYMPGEYQLPIDGEEQDRMDFQHHCYKILLDGNISIVPFESPPEWVVDIGTGTGIWAIEFGELNPTSHVFGTDLSRIQPDPRTPNVTWILENSEKHEWTYFEPLDFIHFRNVGPCFDDFPALLRKCYDHMRPGGWIELCDSMFEVRCDDGTARGTSLPGFFQLLVLGAMNLGRDLLKPKDFRAWVEKAGFVDIQEVMIPTPGSPWPADPKMKVVGYYVGKAAHAAAESYRKFLMAAGLTPDAIDDAIRRLRKDLDRVDVHWYVPTYIVIGRKPDDAPFPTSTHAFPNPAHETFDSYPAPETSDSYSIPGTFDSYPSRLTDSTLDGDYRGF